MSTRSEPLGSIVPESRGTEIATVGEILRMGLGLLEDRHPVRRTGDRDPIPGHVRSAVWLRDHGKCELCGTTAGEEWELDHIVPWSAGGSDRTENLRVLCIAHNQDRSNRIDLSERRHLPASWWCLNCFSTAPEGWAIHWTPGEWGCLSHRWPCTVSRGLDWAAENDEPNWYARDLIDPAVNSLVSAFCAHCNAPGLTDQPL